MNVGSTLAVSVTVGSRAGVSIARGDILDWPISPAKAAVVSIGISSVAFDGVGAHPDIQNRRRMPAAADIFTRKISPRFRRI
jgi:ABC-type glucose/galactose transport system permease subunit